MTTKRSILILVGCMVLLSGCVQQESNEHEKTKLRVAIFQGAYDTSYWQDAKEAFEDAHENVEVELTIDANIGNILLPRMRVGDVPDVVYLGSTNDSGYTQRMIEEQRIAPLDDVFDASLQAQFLPNVLQSKLVRPYHDARLYLAPLYYNVTGLWYNEALFEAHGYEVPATWDEFLALGAQAKKDGVALFVYQGLTPSYLEAMLWPMLAENIGLDGLQRIFQQQPQAWHQEGVLEALSVFQQIADAGYMSEDTISLTYTQAQKRFLHGEALFLPCGNWLLREMSDEITEQTQVSFMSVPSFTLGAKRYATVMMEQIYVPKDAKQPALGKAFLVDQFQERALMLNQQKSGGLVPIRQEHEAFEQHEPFRIFSEGVQPLTIDFDLGRNGDLEHEIYEQLSLVLARQITAEEMMDVLDAL